MVGWSEKGGGHYYILCASLTHRNCTNSRSNTRYLKIRSDYNCSVIPGDVSFICNTFLIYALYPCNLGGIYIKNLANSYREHLRWMDQSNDRNSSFRAVFPAMHSHICKCNRKNRTGAVRHIQDYSRNSAPFLYVPLIIVRKLKGDIIVKVTGWWTFRQLWLRTRLRGITLWIA